MRTLDEARAIAADCLARVIARSEYALENTYTRAAKRNEELAMVQRIVAARKTKSRKRATRAE